jgi:hypothetical protein
MTHYSVGDMETPGPDDPPEPTTRAADLHIVLLPSDQSCAPAGEAADLHIVLLPSDQSYAPAGERDSADLTWGVILRALGSAAP